MLQIGGCAGYWKILFHFVLGEELQSRQEKDETKHNDLLNRHINQCHLDIQQINNISSFQNNFVTEKKPKSLTPKRHP